MAPAEPEVLREYRHLLRTAPADWQETAHRHALMSLGPEARTEVLAHVRLLLLTGYRVGPDDVHAVARLIVLAERRRARTIIDGLPPALRDRLAGAVVSSPVGRMLRAGIDVWDGTEPADPEAGDPAPADLSSDAGECWSRTTFGTELVAPDLGSAWTTPPPPVRRY